MNWPASDPEGQRWTAIGAGLLIGLGCKYAILMQDHRAFGFRDLAIDLLLLAANALMASIVVARLNLHGQEAMAVAALFGASSDRIVRVVRKAFEKRIERQAAVIFTDADTPTAVPPSRDGVEVQPISAGDRPELRPLEVLRKRLLSADDAELAAILQRLDPEVCDEPTHVFQRHPRRFHRPA